MCRCLWYRLNGRGNYVYPVPVYLSSKITTSINASPLDARLHNNTPAMVVHTRPFSHIICLPPFLTLDFDRKISSRLNPLSDARTRFALKNISLTQLEANMTKLAGFGFLLATLLATVTDATASTDAAEVTTVIVEAPLYDIRLGADGGCNPAGCSGDLTRVSNNQIYMLRPYLIFNRRLRSRTLSRYIICIFELFQVLVEDMIN